MLVNNAGALLGREVAGANLREVRVRDFPVRVLLVHTETLIPLTDFCQVLTAVAWAGVNSQQTIIRFSASYQCARFDAVRGSLA